MLLEKDRFAKDHAASLWLPGLSLTDRLAQFLLFLATNRFHPTSEQNPSLGGQQSG
jgi:hypothetical protein